MKSKSDGGVPSISQIRRDYRRLMQDVNPLETFELRRAGMLDAHVERVVTEVNRAWRGSMDGSARPSGETREAAWERMVSSLPSPPVEPPALTRCPCLCLDASDGDVRREVRQLVESVRGNLREIRGRISILERRRG